jgi:hypothetical protein
VVPQAPNIVGGDLSADLAAANAVIEILVAAAADPLLG